MLHNYRLIVSRVNDDIDRERGLLAEVHDRGQKGGLSSRKPGSWRIDSKAGYFLCLPVSASSLRRPPPAGFSVVGGPICGQYAPVRPMISRQDLNGRGRCLGVDCPATRGKGRRPLPR